ncbi:uncharacterized protein LOC141902192 [Tubulanus polymorphus]|uniref:uncharacterized protein LOC141902192 n=1 Tax=Tubulanus polymorphus TaxID=672921 RepID=UPI003DA26E60
MTYLVHILMTCLLINCECFETGSVYFAEVATRGNDYSIDGPYLSIDNNSASLISCSAACSLDTKCKSFNYHGDSSVCELSDKLPIGPTFRQRNGTAFRFKCSVLEDDCQRYIIFSVRSEVLSNSTHCQDIIFKGLCVPFYSLKPVSCTDVLIRGDTTDKTYDLYPIKSAYKRKFRIFCHAMMSLTPREYLPLPAGRKNNFSEAKKSGIYRVWKDWCYIKFWRVRISIWNYIVIKTDYRFASVNCNPTNKVKYGEAKACARYNSGMGAARIDLTQTGFKIAHGVTWKKYGYGRWNMVGPTFTANRQIMNIKCRAQCGGCNNNNALQLTPL